MAGKTLFCKFDCPKPTTVFNWLSNNQSSFLYVTLWGECSYIDDWHRDSVDPYQPCQAAFMMASIQSSKAVNVNNMMILAWLPILFNNWSKFKSSLPMPLKSSTWTQHGETPFSATRSRLSWAYNKNQRSSPKKQKIVRFSKKVVFPRSKKALHRSFGFLSYYRKYIPRLA